MTDPDLVAKRLAFIETCVQQLRTMSHPDRIFEDVREERFVLHTLQLAIQATLDVGSHLVSDERLGEPETSRDVFRLLGLAGVLPSALAGRLQEMAGFRNVLVHGYTTVDLAVVRGILQSGLGDLLEFAAVIRARL